MTGQIILPINEVTDSVEMLHEKPNKGMPVFTWISEFTLNVEKNTDTAEKNISDLEYSLKGQNQSYSAYSEISHNEELAKDNAKLEMLTVVL